MAPTIVRKAIIEGDYRYQLSRDWCAKPAGQDTVAFIMVNPSTADGQQDDATIRKCMGFATRWGFKRLLVGNVFAYRATDIRELRQAEDPIGPNNSAWLRLICHSASQVVVAWGPLGKLPRDLRWQWKTVPRIMASLNKPMAMIGPTTNDGMPRHPLMLAYDTPRQWWKPPT